MKILVIILLLLVVYLFERSVIHESFTTNNVKVVIARYNESMEWLNDEPFNKYSYIVYNKGINHDYLKTNKFEDEIKLDNIGRETHSYLTYIIDNYDNKTFSDFTLFIPGSIDNEIKFDRAKKLFRAIETTDKNIFSCVLLEPSVLSVYKDFQIDKYLSTNKNNSELNKNDTIEISKIRPFSKWYTSVFDDKNENEKCFVQNGMFGLKKDTILNKPKSYYIKLREQVNNHNNPETGHYFERSWKTVFFPYNNEVLELY